MGNMNCLYKTHLKSSRDSRGLETDSRQWGMSVLLRQRDWNYKDNPDIKWNFTKFLIDRKGSVVDRFEPTASMNLLEGRIIAVA